MEAGANEGAEGRTKCSSDVVTEAPSAPLIDTTDVASGIHFGPLLKNVSDCDGADSAPPSAVAERTPSQGIVLRGPLAVVPAVTQTQSSLPVGTSQSVVSTNAQGMQNPGAPQSNNRTTSWPSLNDLPAPQNTSGGSSASQPPDERPDLAEHRKRLHKVLLESESENMELRAQLGKSRAFTKMFQEQLAELQRGLTYAPYIFNAHAYVRQCTAGLRKYNPHEIAANPALAKENAKWEAEQEERVRKTKRLFLAERFLKGESLEALLIEEKEIFGEKLPGDQPVMVHASTSTVRLDTVDCATSPADLKQFVDIGVGTSPDLDAQRGRRSPTLPMIFDGLGQDTDTSYVDLLQAQVQPPSPPPRLPTASASPMRNEEKKSKKTEKVPLKMVGDRPGKTSYRLQTPSPPPRTSHARGKTSYRLKSPSPSAPPRTPGGRGKSGKSSYRLQSPSPPPRNPRARASSTIKAAHKVPRPPTPPRRGRGRLTTTKAKETASSARAKTTVVPKGRSASATVSPAKRQKRTRSASGTRRGRPKQAPTVVPPKRQKTSTKDLAIAASAKALPNIQEVYLLQGIDSILSGCAGEFEREALRLSLIADSCFDMVGGRSRTRSTTRGRGQK